MDEALFMKLPLADRAEFVKKHGNFVEAQDYYSYQVFQYSLEKHIVELLYDFDHNLINIEFIEAKIPSDFLNKQIESNMEETSDSLE